MKLNRPKRTWLPSIISGICLWLSPFVVFLRFQDYSLWHLEIWIALALLTAIGTVTGLLMEALGQYTRWLVLSLLITLVFDIQLQQADRTRLLWLVFTGSAVVTFLLRNHLVRFGTLTLLAIFLTSFVSPTGRKDAGYAPGEDTTPGDPSLPLSLHIILDEHIGVEGIPNEFDPDAHHAEGLRDFYLDRGFQVYGRAYSRFFNTWATIPNLMNFDFRGRETAFRGGVKGGFFVTKNAYFDLMRKRGYELHVYQTRFLEYCGEKTRSDFATCFTYGLEVLSSIERSGMPFDDKLRIIFGVYTRLSEILLDLRLPPSRLSSISAMGIMDQVKNDVSRAAPGMLFVVHLMLPHYPYAYDESCDAYDDPWSWLYSMDYSSGGDPRRNSEASRAERYPYYLAQVSCTTSKLGKLFDALEEAGLYDDMKIVVHGDHGSRITRRVPDRRKPTVPISNSDYVDCFSTLFAVKLPGVPARYDRRILPIGPLFESVVMHGRVPNGTEWAGEQAIQLKGLSPKLGARPMPNFGRSLSRPQP